MQKTETIAVVGLGYVGLPVALAFAKKYERVIGFDINRARIDELKSGHDRTNETDAAALKATRLHITCRPGRPARGDLLRGDGADPHRLEPAARPDPGGARLGDGGQGAEGGRGGGVRVHRLPGRHRGDLRPHPGAALGAQARRGLQAGLLPRAHQPGRPHPRAGEGEEGGLGRGPESSERVAKAYGSIIEAGVHRAPSIKVAEAAKVIENTQRDLNIALMNELALIFDRMGIRTRDVLAAAGTKWNFLPFTPGLVGGHCIGVDPYYLTAKAESLGYHPEVILAGRRINDGMGAFIAQRLVKLLIAADLPVKGAKVGVLGLTFKENVPDLRNSRVPDILGELKQFGIEAIVHDPHGDAGEAHEEYGVTLSPLEKFKDLSAVVLAVSHREYLELLKGPLFAMVKKGGVVVDVKSMIDPGSVPAGLSYWCLWSFARPVGGRGAACWNPRSARVKFETRFRNRVSAPRATFLVAGVEHGRGRSGS